MSQFTWTYIGDNGALHRVGLFHGDETGHLMIYCNTRIVVIDFGVTTSKNYSFFINDDNAGIAIYHQMTGLVTVKKPYPM